MTTEQRARYGDELRGLLLRAYEGMRNATGRKDQDVVAITTAGRDMLALMKDGQSFIDRLIADISVERDKSMPIWREETGRMETVWSNGEQSQRPPATSSRPASNGINAMPSTCGSP